jgi:hypothetical protein
METVVRRLIRRVGGYDPDPAGTRPTIIFADLTHFAYEHPARVLLP